ncbi:MAG: hypothetical protein ACLP19_18195 [Xanthobacteraceae bacterium]
MGSAGETVTIASKLPMSLNCQLQVERVETIRNGPHVWTEPRFVYEGPAYTIRGMGVPRGAIPPRYVMPQLVADNSAALTPNIPRDHAEHWFKQQAGADFIKNGLVYIVGHKDTAGQAKELKNLHSGFQPLEPIVHDRDGNKIGGDPRWPKRGTGAGFMGAGEPTE